MPVIEGRILRCDRCGKETFNKLSSEWVEREDPYKGIGKSYQDMPGWRVPESVVFDPIGSGFKVMCPECNQRWKDLWDCVNGLIEDFRYEETDPPEESK